MALAQDKILATFVYSCPAVTDGCGWIPATNAVEPRAFSWHSWHRWSPDRRSIDRIRSPSSVLILAFLTFLVALGCIACHSKGHGSMSMGKNLWVHYVISCTVRFYEQCCWLCSVRVFDSCHVKQVVLWEKCTSNRSCQTFSLWDLRLRCLK
jgi:hypothetical protein